MFPRKKKSVSFNEAQHSPVDKDDTFESVPHELDEDDRNYEKYLNKYKQYQAKDKIVLLSQDEYDKLLGEYQILQERQFKEGYDAERWRRMVDIVRQCLFE